MKLFGGHSIFKLKKRVRVLKLMKQSSKSEDNCKKNYIYVLFSMIVNICDIFVLLIIVYMDCSILLCAQIKLLLLL